MNTYIENSNEAIFFLYLAPDSSPKWPHPYGVIQQKRYMDEYFCIQTSTCWKTQKHHDSNFLLFRGSDSSPKRAICPLTDLFCRTDTWMNVFAFKLLHLGVHINTNDSNFLLFRGPDISPKGPYVPWLIYSAEQIHGYYTVYLLSI